MPHDGKLRGTAAAAAGSRDVFGTIMRRFGLKVLDTAAP